MRKIILTAVFTAIALSAGAYFPMKKGTVLEYKYYDNNGKPLRDSWRNERWTRLTVEDTWGDSVANVVIENETFARLAEVEAVRDIIDGLSYGDVRTTPDEVVFENVMWQFLPEQLYQVPDDVDKQAQSNDFVKNFVAGSTTRVTLSATAGVPRELKVGDQLPDVRYEAVLKEEVPEETLANRQGFINKINESLAEVNLAELDESNRSMIEAVRGMDLSKPATIIQTAMVRNRRVVAFEKVGEYDCWKITYEIVGPTERMPGIPKFKMGANGNMELDNSAPPIVGYIDYISPEIGLVRREKLNFRRNRIEEVMALTSVEN